jgi:hypothetical protein
MDEGFPQRIHDLHGNAAAVTSKAGNRRAKLSRRMIVGNPAAVTGSVGRRAGHQMVHGHFSVSMRTTPKVILVLIVKVAPGGGVDVHTTQFRSTIWLRPLPVSQLSPSTKLARWSAIELHPGPLVGPCRSNSASSMTGQLKQLAPSRACTQPRGRSIRVRARQIEIARFQPPYGCRIGPEMQG